MNFASFARLRETFTTFFERHCKLRPLQTITWYAANQLNDTTI